MKKLSLFFVLFLMLVGLNGCGGGGGGVAVPQNPTGTIKVQLDLLSLAPPTAARALAVTAPTITSASVVLTRTGYSDITQDLTIVGNVASTTITGLEQGYWHVAVSLYSDQSLTYDGSVDVNVVAGATVAADVLFDPSSGVTTPVTTGSVALTAGFNKYPGYTKIRQFVSTILQDKVNGKLYIFDSSAGVIGVYNADTMVREKDLTPPATPQALAVDPAGGSILLGYSTGRIYRLQVADGSVSLLADALMSVTALVPVSSNILLVCNDTNWGPTNTYVSINLSNGQIVSSKTDWYPLNSFTLDPVTGVTYALDSGLSPADIHRIVVNPQTGSIDAISDSRYHGDYYFGSPIRAINKGSRIVTGSGNMFISSPLASEDITYAGNIGHPFVDLASDDTLGYLYMLNSDNVMKLLVIDQSSLFTSLTLDLIANPKQLFITPSSIIVFAKPDSDYYVKVISKTSLGLQ
ncbi:hypothetical protein L4X63_16345 [Geomonas sp. Red32]|uniref:hypothetical protein n=1 Tax=Geomonas sp. Red32 TaxID=2912856 RepID=UPI00202CD505|nr:hypothetical protein [Geomonas sp. Red32]MCM0083156.1 hypothetical protein [Geomonas sp. Red32]